MSPALGDLEIFFKKNNALLDMDNTVVAVWF